LSGLAAFPFSPLLPSSIWPRREGAAIAATLGAREGLAEKLSAEALPYDGADGDEAWAWRCRTVGCPGVLHTAGYSREKRAIVALCDGCGLIALR
jgi:hypothetical protein